MSSFGSAEMIHSAKDTSEMTKALHALKVATEAPWEEEEDQEKYQAVVKMWAKVARKHSADPKKVKMIEKKGLNPELGAGRGDEELQEVYDEAEELTKNIS